MVELILKLLLVVWAIGTAGVFVASLTTWFVYRGYPGNQHYARWVMRCWAWPLAIPPLMRDLIHDATDADDNSKEDA